MIVTIAVIYLENGFHVIAAIATIPADRTKIYLSGRGRCDRW